MTAPHPAPFEPFFAHTGAQGQRLCIHTPAQGPAVAAVLHVHAFAEEMNKSRRMVAMTARALAGRGVAVLQIDLLGCGDSDGELSEAGWAAWLGDLAWALNWLRQRHPGLPLWLWGHRAGALLAAQAARAAGHPCHLLWWNPVLQGKAVVQQFLRLKAAAEWASGDGKAAIEQARAELARGEVIEIAGYPLAPTLVADFERASLAPPPLPAMNAEPVRLVWLETGQSSGEATLSPAAQLQLPKWEAAGYRVEAQAVSGPAFWQTVEIEDAPQLVAATVAALLGSPTAFAPAPAGLAA